MTSWHPVDILAFLPLEKRDRFPLADDTLVQRLLTHAVHVVSRSILCDAIDFSETGEALLNLEQGRCT